MRYTLFVCTSGLIALSVGLGLLVAAPDDSIGGFDPYHPATLLPIVATGFWEVHSLVRGWVNAALVELHDVLQRTDLRQAVPQ